MNFIITFLFTLFHFNAVEERYIAVEKWDILHFSKKLTLQRITRRDKEKQTNCESMYKASDELLSRGITDWQNQLRA